MLSASLSHHSSCIPVPRLSHDDSDSAWNVPGPGRSLVVGAAVALVSVSARSSAGPQLCPRLPHVLAHDPPTSQLTSCVAADAPTGHELVEGCLPCDADPCARPLVLHTAEEGAAGLGWPVPRTLAPCGRSQLRLSALRACMAWVPANSKPRRAVTGQECRPGTHRGAWRQGPSQCCASETSCQKRWFFKPCSAASSRPGSEPVFALQRDGPPLCLATTQTPTPAGH